MDIITTSVVVGFFGDIGLQLLVAQGFGGPTGWGLKPYFEQHGIVESMFIAAAIITIPYILYLYVLKLPLNLYYLFIYGMLIDLFFRKTMFFPSLATYYQVQNYFETMIIGGALPVILPLLVYNIL